MTRNERLRRAARICCHFLRNMAFYRAGWRGKALRCREDFWVNTNSNSMDVAVLEWCKLFTERSGKHHWKKIVANPVAFKTGLLTAVRMSDKEFRAYAKTLLRYRNKFIAHLDDDRVMHVPRMRTARKCVAYLYHYILSDPSAKDALRDVPPLRKFYSIAYAAGRQEYDDRAGR